MDLHKMKLSIILNKIMNSKSVKEKNSFVRISTLASMVMKQANLLFQNFVDEAFDVAVPVVSHEHRNNLKQS